MQEQMIYGESPSFSNLLKHLNDVSNVMKEIDWKIDGDF